jgi:anti-sigma B factor antagonist
MSDTSGAVRVETRNVQGRSVVTVSGEVDLRSAPQLRTLLLDAGRDHSRPLLIDLSGVNYMDSSGVGTMVFVKREVERSGGKVILIGLQPRVRSVFEITHLDKFFTIVGSIDEVTET